MHKYNVGDLLEPDWEAIELDQDEDGCTYSVCSGDVYEMLEPDAQYYVIRQGRTRDIDTYDIAFDADAEYADWSIEERYLRLVEPITPIKKAKQDLWRHLCQKA